MPVHAVMLRLGHDIRLVDLVLYLLSRLSLGNHVAAEFTGKDNESAIEQAALFQIKNQLGHRCVDRLLHADGTLMAVFVSIPIPEWNVLGGDLDEARTGFHQPPRQQAT